MYATRVAVFPLLVPRCSDDEEAAAGVGTYFGSRTMAHGMLVRVSGDIIMMSPHLIITEGEVREVSGLEVHLFMSALLTLL